MYLYDVECERVVFQIYWPDITRCNDEFRNVFFNCARCLECNQKFDLQKGPCWCGVPFQFCWKYLQNLNPANFDKSAFLGKFYVSEKAFNSEIYDLYRHFQRSEYNRYYAPIKRERRKERLKEAGGKHSKEDIDWLFDAQNRLCHFCMRSITEVRQKDHLTPVSGYGGDCLTNIALVCPDCNHSKSDRTEAEFWGIIQKQLPPDVFETARRKALNIRRRKSRRVSKRKR